MQARTLAVVGATGNCGRAVIAAAKAHELRVIALVRDPARLGPARAACDEVRTVQVTEPESLRGAFDGADVVLSALGKTRQKDRIPRWQIDVQANLNVFAEARRSRIGLVGLVSMFGARSDHPIAMTRMKGEAERGLEQSGQPWIIVQPTGFFSDLWDVFQMARSGTVWTVGSADLALNPISLQDLGEFIVRALLEDANVGRRLPVGGPELLRMRDMAEAAGRVLGRRVKVRQVPIGLAQVLVGALRPFSRNAWELAQFFVGSAQEIRDQGGSLSAPRFGERRLEDYFRSRWTREAPPARTATAPAPPARPSPRR